MATRWGILSTGRMSNDFTASVKDLSSEEHQIVAVAGRNKQKAEEFASKFGIPRSYGSYEELAKDKEIDVVYIGVVHFLHFSVSKLMLDNGKHVLCELPLCVNTGEAKRLVALAKEKNLFLMEALMCAFLPLYDKLREELKNKTIGNVRQVMVTSGWPIAERPAWSNPKTGGSLLAMGFPALYLVTQVFGNKMPLSVNTVGILNNSGSDNCGTCILDYGKEGIASVTFSILGRYPNEAHIFGTKGSIKMCTPYWTSPKMYVNDVEYNSNVPAPNYPTFYHNDTSLNKLAEHVRYSLRKGLIEGPGFTTSESLFLIELADKLRTQMKIKFLD